MGNSNGLITAPVSLHADVYAVLGLQKTGTYYDIGYICSNQHGRTNMWSRKKPVRYHGPAELTEAQWKANNYGLPVQVAQSAEVAMAQAVDTLWEYLPPRPGTDWCRLTDWVGYRHNAVKPFETRLFATNGVTGSFNPSLSMGGSRTTGGNVDFTLEDLGVWNNPSRAYWCLLWQDMANSSNPVNVAGADPTQGTGDFPLDRVANDLTVSITVPPGTYRMAGCIYSYGQGFVCLPDSYMEATVINQSASEVYGFEPYAYAVAQQGSPKKLYIRAGLKYKGDQVLNVRFQLSFYILQNGQQMDYLRYTGQQQMDFSQVGEDTYIYFNFAPWANDVSGQYYVFYDQSGLNNATYRYELIIWPNESELYRMTKSGGMAILPEGVDIS